MNPINSITMDDDDKLIADAVEEVRSRELS